MLPSNPIEIMNVYASQSQYVSGPDSAAQAAGTVPLDTLPADWWNWLWKQVTTRINEASNGMESVYNEILSVLEAASITPSETSTTDLVNAIKAIAHTVGSSTTAGAVKSSAASGKVAIDADGYMTPNGMGTPTSLNTTAKVIVNAINEILSDLDSYKTSNDDAVTGLANSKAPTNHATSSTTYGTGTSINYGHVKLSDSTSSTSSAAEGVAATPAAVKNVSDALIAYKTTNDNNVSGKAPTNHATSSTTYGTGTSANYGHVKLTDAIDNESGADSGIAASAKAVKTVQDNVTLLNDNLTLPAGIVLPFAGATVPSGWVLCNGQSLDRTSYARLFAVIGTTYGSDGDTTFKVPDLRETTPVGIGQRGSGVTTHNVLALGTFQDDQFASHTHTFTGSEHTHTFNGTAASHSHTFTPSGSISMNSHSHGLNNHSHSFSGTTGGMSANSTGRFTESNNGIVVSVSDASQRPYTPSGCVSASPVAKYGGNGIGEGRWTGYLDNATINVSHTHSFSGDTGGNSGNTTSTTSTGSFSGTQGTTGSTNITPSGTNTKTTAGGSNSSTGATSRGTHGKLLGMNYIIKI